MQHLCGRLIVLYALPLCVRLMHVLYAVEAFHMGLVLTWSGSARFVRASISSFEHTRYCRPTGVPYSSYLLALGSLLACVDCTLFR